MNIVFYNRNFTGTVFHNFDIRVERYSHTMLGGPDKATFKIKSNADKWELMKFLRCPVEIYGADGGVKWWGYVDRVTLPHGVNRIGKGLDEMYNSITTKHDAGTLTASTDAQSVAEYGEKEFVINLESASATDAAVYQAIYLDKHKRPVQELELSGGTDEIIMECYGWWHSLSWCYYSNASVVVTENTTQIRNIITACGQFIEGVIVNGVGVPIDWTNGAVIEWDDANEPIEWDSGGASSGMTSVPTRDGSNTALAYIMELLNAGSVNIRPMLAYVDKFRWLHVYERNLESVEFIMRNDGDLETKLGKIVEPENCLSAVWVGMKGAPPAAIDPFFIERAEWVDGKVHYTSAESFAATRLDRYIQDAPSRSGGTTPRIPPSGGYGGTPSNPDPDDGIPAIVVAVEATQGLVYTTNFNAADPNDVLWLVWNTGLTAAQYQSTQKLMSCLSGGFFIANFASNVNTFIARAGVLGGAFTILQDYTSISALYGGSTDNIHVAAVGQDKTASEFVVYSVCQAGENNKFFISTGGGVFNLANATLVLGTNNDADLSFGDLHWMFTASGYIASFNAAFSGITYFAPAGPLYMSRHRRVAATGLTYHWDDDGTISGFGLGRGEDNGATFEGSIGNYLDSNQLYEDRVVCDDVVGINFMARNNTVAPVRSADGGYTWQVMSSLLPAIGSWYFDCFYGSLTSWIAVGGGTVQYTDDFGVTWEDRTGNLTDLVGSPDLKAVKFIL